VGPQFNADAAQHQQPENEHQRQIEAAETGSVEQRERKVESAYAASANRREPTESMTYKAEFVPNWNSTGIPVNTPLMKLMLKTLAQKTCRLI
jgi:hypothetical protein